MKKTMLAILMMVSAQSAFASTSMLDNALNANLMEKQQIQKDHAESQVRPKSIRGDRLNAKYEIIEVGDEMGSFAAAKKDSYHDDSAVVNKANAENELKEINAEVSDSQNL